MPTPPELGPAEGRIGQCSYGPEGRPGCDADAVWHLLGEKRDALGRPWAMVSCDEHFKFAQAYAKDWHRLEPACLSAGAVWQFRERGTGFCFTPDGDEFTEELSKWVDVGDLVGATGNSVSP